MQTSPRMAYAKVSIEGIQRFICATGKLKEMIGGSELIYQLARPQFYNNVAAGIGLCIGEDENADAMVTQANAGSLCVVFPEPRQAREFLKAYSANVLANYPGVPIYGACAPMSWQMDSYKQARREADELIAIQRASSPQAAGLGMLPVCRPARLDGQPAVAIDRQKDDNRGEFISLVSQTRRLPALIKSSNERLRKLVPAQQGMEYVWSDNLNEMLGADGAHVALICMDGNDLGKVFREKLEEHGKKELSEGIKGIMGFSRLIQDCNDKAFAAAVSGLVPWLTKHEPVNVRKDKDGHIIRLPMPLRPLVLGGDDVTVIVRADLALAFVTLFVREFERLSRELNNGHPLSLGVGMVVMGASYPFVKAFPLAEALQKKAKKFTQEDQPRPSSIDYLVLTEDVENNADDYRERVYKAEDGSILTAKPFNFDEQFCDFLAAGVQVLNELPRSQIRNAWTLCRDGKEAAAPAWENLKENLATRIGGRHDKFLMSEKKFLKLFPKGFFFEDGQNGKRRTKLGDYLELSRLLPQGDKEREDMLNLIIKGACDVQ